MTQLEFHCTHFLSKKQLASGPYNRPGSRVHSILASCPPPRLDATECGLKRICSEEAWSESRGTLFNWRWRRASEPGGAAARRRGAARYRRWRRRARTASRWLRQQEAQLPPAPGPGRARRRRLRLTSLLTRRRGSAADASRRALGTRLDAVLLPPRYRPAPGRLRRSPAPSRGTRPQPRRRSVAPMQTSIVRLCKRLLTGYTVIKSA